MRIWLLVLFLLFLTACTPQPAPTAAETQATVSPPPFPASTATARPSPVPTQTPPLPTAAATDLPSPTPTQTPPLYRDIVGDYEYFVYRENPQYRLGYVRVFDENFKFIQHDVYRIRFDNSIKKEKLHENYDMVKIAAQFSTSVQQNQYLRQLLSLDPSIYYVPVVYDPQDTIEQDGKTLYRYFMMFDRDTSLPWISYVNERSKEIVQNGYIENETNYYREEPWYRYHEPYAGIEYEIKRFWDDEGRNRIYGEKPVDYNEIGAGYSALDRMWVNYAARAMFFITPEEPDFARLLRLPVKDDPSVNAFQNVMTPLRKNGISFSYIWDSVSTGYVSSRAYPFAVTAQMLFLARTDEPEQTAEFTCRADGRNYTVHYTPVWLKVGDSFYQHGVVKFIEGVNYDFQFEEYRLEDLPRYDKTIGGFDYSKMEWFEAYRFNSAQDLFDSHERWLKRIAEAGGGNLVYPVQVSFPIQFTMPNGPRTAIVTPRILQYYVSYSIDPRPEAEKFVMNCLPYDHYSEFIESGGREFTLFFNLEYAAPPIKLEYRSRDYSPEQKYIMKVNSIFWFDVFQSFFRFGEEFREFLK